MDENLIKHIYHPFYKKVDKLVDDVRLMQLQKGAEKYPEPFTPSNWTGKELAIHALQELRDGQVYVVGLYELIEELEDELRDWKYMFHLLKSDHELDENFRTGEWQKLYRDMEGESE
ncbi:hypothetical protein [Oceanobacillus alkalisoli]|uniref:hypothetical protein n=1 Tax=Oceanobacillus alkalisoli TaxID=2925113 RepID=UPI001F122009|nr:hypothetical protein [Oceanobacillus alkalisoli]MCF3942183.1 hypothetical protein [Oceanobacillus alkalisoli]